jgi:hypothetical protein
MRCNASSIKTPERSSYGEDIVLDAIIVGGRVKTQKERGPTAAKTTLCMMAIHMASDTHGHD